MGEEGFGIFGDDGIYLASQHLRVGVPPHVGHLLRKAAVEVKMRPVGAGLDEGAASGATRDEVVGGQPPEGLPDGLPADAVAVGEVLLRGQRGAGG